MKKTIPSKEITACDVCGRETGYLQECPVCGREYCLVCEALVYGCIHAMDICRKCGEDPRVLKIAMEYAPKIIDVLQARNNELKRLSLETMIAKTP